MSEAVVITKAEYIASAVKPDQYPVEALPEFAFIGRSNVGKSSLINSLTRVQQLARVSGQPGKTQTINFFELTLKIAGRENRERAYLVDLPGYGYARTSKENRKTWGKFIREYFLKSQSLRFVCLLLDIRHTPTSTDKEMFNWLVDNQIPTLVIATKADKISRSVKTKHINEIKKALGVPELSVLPYSSKKNNGRIELLEVVRDELIGEIEET